MTWGSSCRRTSSGSPWWRRAAGMKGDTDKVRELTGAQALVVRDYLVQNFQIDDTRVKTMGLGSRRRRTRATRLTFWCIRRGNVPVAEKSQR